jgi:N-acetylglucosamine repressor
MRGQEEHSSFSERIKVGMRPAGKQLMRDMNVAAVVDCVRRHGRVARVDISKRTGLGRSTVTELVSFLIDDGLLVEAGTDVSSGGRRPVLLELVPSARYAVGVKLAPEAVTAAVVDLSATVVGRSQRPVSRSLPAQQVLTAVVDAVRAALDDVSASSDQVIGVGVALPGIVDPERGTSISPTFFGWSNLAVRDELEAVLGVPVVVENDANAFALAECVHGAGRGFSHVIAVTIGVGVGAGLITNGWIYRGGIAGAGELGHITITQSGPVCVCGNRGCLESRVSDQAIAAAAAAKGSVEATTRARVVAASL